MEIDGGRVLWGALFTANEVTALTNLVREPATDSSDVPPQYLCLFAWKDHRWVFRQFLGNAYGLEIHYRKDYPSIFLQATYKTGRYEGEFFSWSYDEKKERLVPTDFEDWGPFYLAGNYLCLLRGYERRAHDISHWIYAYRDGHKGALLATVHEVDTGPFEVNFLDQIRGKRVAWSFTPHDHESGSISVSVGNESDTAEPPRQGEIACEGDCSVGYFFELLTGLSANILNDKWCDELPRRPLKRIPIHATGDKEIVQRLQWPPFKTARPK